MMWSNHFTYADTQPLKAAAVDPRQEHQHILYFQDCRVMLAKMELAEKNAFISTCKVKLPIARGGARDRFEKTRKLSPECQAASRHHNACPAAIVAIITPIIIIIIMDPGMHLVVIHQSFQLLGYYIFTCRVEARGSPSAWSVGVPIFDITLLTTNIYLCL